MNCEEREVYSCKGIYLRQHTDDERKNAVLAMAIGLEVSKTNVGELKIPKKHLVEEAQRRYKQQGLRTLRCRPQKPGTNWNKDQLLEWLRNHPVNQNTDIAFVREKTAHLRLCRSSVRPDIPADTVQQKLESSCANDDQNGFVDISARVMANGSFHFLLKEDSFLLDGKWYLNASPIGNMNSALDFLQVESQVPSPKATELDSSVSLSENIVDLTDLASDVSSGIGNHQQGLAMNVVDEGETGEGGSSQNSTLSPTPSRLAHICLDMSILYLESSVSSGRNSHALISSRMSTQDLSLKDVQFPCNQEVRPTAISNIEIEKDGLTDARGKVGNYSGHIHHRLDGVVQPHGKGRMAYKDGMEYEGDWSYGEWHGYGKLSRAVNDYYAGYFAHGSYRGSGIRVWPDRSEYDGLWENGKRWGKGIFTDATQCVHDGNWENDMLVGNGRVTFPDGSKYEGNFVDGLQQGRCKYKDHHGRQHVGEWVSRCRLLDGSMYDGLWKDGKPHGFGKRSYANGAVYKGEYCNGQEHGQGCYRHPTNGSQYIGAFHRGQRRGKCKHIDRHGTKKSGTWVSNRRLGRRGDGPRYDGLWADGMPHGFGTCRFRDGEVYEGEFLDGARNGQGCWTAANGAIQTSGFWLDDSPFCFTGKSIELKKADEKKKL